MSAERDAAGRRGAVLVTGASSGIGRACAELLPARGCRVFAGLRDPRAATAPHTTPLALDVGDAASLAEAARSVERELGGAGLAGLVHAAGSAAWAPLEVVPLPLLRAQLELNVVAAVATIQAFLPLLRRARGRIVLLGSVSGRCALPFLGPYAASKFALEAIADALRVELRASGVAVSLLEMGRIATPIWRKAAAEAERLRKALSPEAEALYGRAFDALRAGADAERGLPAAEAAKRVAQILEARRPRARYVVGRDARRELWWRRLPDALWDARAQRRMPGARRDGVR